MKLLNLKQTSIRQTDVVFGNSGAHWAVAMVLTWGLVAAGVHLLVFGHIGKIELPWWAVTWVGLFALLFAWLSTNSWRAARRPTNWVMRVRGNEVLIKFRSYQNWKMSEEDVQVIELHRDEIAFVRERKAKQVSEGMSDGTQVETRVDLEIGLKDVDTAELEKALAAERARPGWGGDRSRTKMLDYPVSAEKGVIRIAWSNRSTAVRPRITRALEELGRLTQVDEAHKGIDDFTPSALKKLSAEEQRTRLAKLARTDQMAAIRTAKEVYGCSTADAMKMVDELAAKA